MKHEVPTPGPTTLPPNDCFCLLSCLGNFYPELVTMTLTQFHTWLCWEVVLHVVFLLYPTATWSISGLSWAPFMYILMSVTQQSSNQCGVLEILTNLWARSFNYLIGLSLFVWNFKKVIHSDENHHTWPAFLYAAFNPAALLAVGWWPRSVAVLIDLLCHCCLALKESPQLSSNLCMTLKRFFCTKSENKASTVVS